MKKIFFATLSLVAGLSFLSSCNEEDIMFYEGGNAVHFVDKERSMTFVTQPESVTAVLEVPVQLVGNIPEKDLTFSVEVVEDEVLQIIKNLEWALSGCKYDREIVYDDKKDR